MRKISKLWHKHWNVLPWFICGVIILIDEEISRFQYGMAWICILLMVWIFMPVEYLGGKDKEKMKKVTSKTITEEQIQEVNSYIGYSEESRELSNYGYAFYYNQMLNGLDLCDADRYANLNTIMGYDVGIRKFKILDGWLYTHHFDLMELVGSDEDRKILQRATQMTGIKELDYSKWNNKRGMKYSYSYFEKGSRYE